MEEIRDKQLLEIAERVSANKLIQLGVHLNIDVADICKYEQMHVIYGGCRGAWDMLQAWKEQTRAKDQRVQLKRALEDAKLGGIADQHFGQLNHIDGEGVSEESTESMNSKIRAMKKATKSVLKLAKSKSELKLATKSAELMRKLLEEQYTDHKRISGNIRGEPTLQQMLTRRDGRGTSSMENSRHDIFSRSGKGKHGKRIVVSGSSISMNTALSHILAFDWATQNKKSPLSEKQLVFELRADLFSENQTIEGAIKQQLFSGTDKVGEALIRQKLEVMPEAITILVDGFDQDHIVDYGDNIMKMLTGQVLKEITVMVTAQPRSADELKRRAKKENVYEHIDMH